MLVQRALIPLNSPAAPARTPAPRAQEADAEATCLICCETVTRTLRRPIECAYCHSRVCVACVKRYILQTDDAECMVCRHAWTRAFVEDVLPKSFVWGPLKKHREEVLFAREKAFLPDTQLQLEHEKHVKELSAVVKKLGRMLDEAKAKLRSAQLEDPRTKAGEMRGQMRLCPAANCRGFLGQEYKCSLCGAEACRWCMTIIDSDAKAEHVCDPDVVSSVQAIQRDSKSCPKCGVMIYRVHGCDQMFCTAPGCNTAFCWRTLRILDRQRIHNPHYYEYLQQLQLRPRPIDRELDDIPCGGMPAGWEVEFAILRSFDVPSLSGNQRIAYEKTILKTFQLFIDMHRFAVHIQRVELARFPASPDIIDPAANQDLRKQYLQNYISEQRFKELLQQREKRRRKTDEIHQILATVSNVSADLFREFIISQSPSPEENMMPHATQNVMQYAMQYVVQNMVALCSYANANLAGISRRYNCRVPLLCSSWKTPLSYTLHGAD